MGITHFSKLQTGTLLEGETGGPNYGDAVLSQSVAIAQNSTSAVSKTMNIPVGSNIITFHVDVLTAFNSGTSATLTIGTAAAGTQYASGVDVKAATGRIAITYTAAQLAAMAGISVLGVPAPTVAPVVVTVTPSGATSAGYVLVTMLYSQ